jgi:hypothetical protein
MKVFSLATLTVVLMVLVAMPAGAQERVAQLTKAAGSVTITRALDGTVDEARQIGPRVRNGSVFAGDVVGTDTGASATVVFSDGSEIRLEESTALTIQETDVSALVASGEREQAVGRRIKVLAGKVFADIVPGGTIATEFETPSGVAAVKGTTLSIEVSAEATK